MRVSAARVQMSSEGPHMGFENVCVCGGQPGTLARLHEFHL